ncbi:MAG: hypothetical protein K2X74_21475 [Acetobacteraceae bacterium]|nr:hypothetical protein [Acetobacteraceae bacterium]
MIRVLKSVDGKLQEDPDLTSHATPAVAPDPEAVAAGLRLQDYVRALAAENKAVFDSLPGEAAKTSFARSLRGR